MSRVHAFNPFHTIQVSLLVCAVSHSSNVLVKIGVERLVFREVLAPRNWIRPPTWSPSCRPVHEPPTEHQNLHSCPYEWDPSHRPGVLWV